MKGGRAATRLGATPTRRHGRSGCAGLRRGLCTLILLALALAASACARAPEVVTPRVVATHPHDPNAFTQGLLLHEGSFYESTGLYGASSLREVEPASGEVLRVRYLEDHLFGEGLARVGERLIQLTWRSGIAFVYDLETFEELGSFTYEGEGWGLCFDGEELWMSDGSATLSVRDPDTFAVERRVEVSRDGEPQEMLNELECTDDLVYANVWLTDEIVAIDKGSGRVRTVVDGARLLPEGLRQGLSRDAVLNGIARDAETGRFYLTGKLWPVVLEVELE